MPQLCQAAFSWLQDLIVGNGTWLYRPRLVLTGFHQGYIPDFLYLAEGLGVVLLIEVIGTTSELQEAGNPAKIPSGDRLLLQEAVLRQGWFLLYISADQTGWDKVAVSLGEIFHPPATPEPAENQ